MARKRKDSYLIIALLLALALGLALTNPSQANFRAWLEIQGSATAKAGTTGAVGQVFGAIGKAVGSLKSNAYSRTNLGLVSLYRSVDSDGNLRSEYLGIARTFIKLK